MNENIPVIESLALAPGEITSRRFCSKVNGVSSYFPIKSLESGYSSGHVGCRSDENPLLASICDLAGEFRVLEGIS